MTLEKTKPGAANTDRAQEQVDVDIVAEINRPNKPLSEIAAALALKGYALHALTDGGWLICRWDRTFHADSVYELKQFAGRV